jgi:hypothetical protein
MFFDPFLPYKLLVMGAKEALYVIGSKNDDI